MITANVFGKLSTLIRSLVLCCACLLVLNGCASAFKSSSHSKSTRQTGPKAQQYYYDKGLQHYTMENFGEAKEAFERVVDAGPNTSLGMKAQENLKKIQQILKTVKDIESK